MGILMNEPIAVCTVRQPVQMAYYVLKPVPYAWLIGGQPSGYVQVLRVIPVVTFDRWIGWCIGSGEGMDTS